MKSVLRCGAIYLAGFLAGKAQAYVSYNGLVTTPAMGAYRLLPSSLPHQHA